MDFLKNQLTRIGEQLGGLSATQKMLAAALVVIMAMTLTYWGNYAGQAEMEPVLDQGFSAEDITRVKSHVASMGISYKVAGDKVLVPTDKKFEVLAALGYAQLLPRDTKSGFDEIAKQMSPWASTNQQQVMWNRAKEITLAQVIRNFPGVQNAVVVIDPTNERSIGQSIKPSAMINMQMRGGEKPGKQLVNAAADVVAGAVSAISRSKIKVTVDGVGYPIRDIDAASGLSGSDDFIETVQKGERYYADKIANQLMFIRGVMVSVTVDVNLKNTHQHTVKYDEVKQKEKKIETESTESTQPGTTSSEPGVQANTGASIGGVGGGTSGGSTTTEKNRTDFEIFPGMTEETSTTPAGMPSVVAASVRVPLSYFSDIYKARNPSSRQDPDESALKPLIDKELLQIKQDVKFCTNIKTDEAITVATYADTMPAGGERVGGASPQVVAGGMGMIVGNHAKEIAVGALAVISLFMVSMMVRKASPPPIAPPVEHKPPTHLAMGEDVAGEVGEGNPALDGMELDEDAVHTKQMLEQVSTMVNENPDGAASLVKRWMNRS